MCNNESCLKVIFIEDYDGFLSYYGRMTERCADFIFMLVMDISCERCAGICRAMNLQISGDSKGNTDMFSIMQCTFKYTKRGGDTDDY